MSTKRIFALVGAIAVAWLAFVAKSWTDGERAPASVTAAADQTTGSTAAPHPKFAD